MSEFQDFRKKYNSFDWEYYGSNYFDGDFKSLKLNKDDCWWHYLTIGKEKNYVFFDLKDKEERIKKNENFDWEEYQLNYDIDKEIYPTQYHLWWHYINIGEPQHYLYFNKNDNYENKKKKFNFDWGFYIKKYPYLFDTSEVNEHKIWWHYLNKGKSNGYKYFSKLDSNNNSLKVNNSLYRRTEFFKHKNNNIFIYVGNALSNITNQDIVITISNILTSQFNQFNFYFVKYDVIIKQLVHLDESEYDILEKKGYFTTTYIKHMLFSKHNSFFESIKNKENNMLLFMEEISAFDINKFEIMTRLFHKVKTCCIYSGNMLLNSLYDNDSGNSGLISKYFNILSKFDIIFTSSLYLKNEIQENFKNLKISIPQIIIPYSLPIEQYGYEMSSIDSINVKKYILALVSINSSNYVIELINAFSLFLEKNPSYQLYIYDNEFNSEVIYWRQVELLLNPNITIIKNKNKNELNNLIKNCLFTISCKKNDHRCEDITQSIFNKKLCICHNSGSAKELETSYPHFIKLTDCSLPELLLKKIEMCKDLTSIEDFNKTLDMGLSISKWSSYCSTIINDLQLKEVIKKNAFDKSQKYQLLFYVEKVLTEHRSGIENYSVQIIKKLCNILNTLSEITLILVKWDLKSRQLISCTRDEVKHILNFGEDNIFKESVIKTDNLEFHKNSLFICPEIPDFKFNMFLSYFLIEKNLKSLFILHDLLPLQFNFKEYEYLLDGFKTYLYNNICTSYKVICVSEFTKNCLNEYLQQHPYHFGYPPIVNIPMSYQFRDEEKNIKLDMDKGDIKIGSTNTFKILLPGSIESRKQQLFFMKIFNKLIKQKPELDVELIVFGQVKDILKKEFEKELIRSNGKIEYLNYISNKELGNLYKEANLTCVISLYEGWGMPIAESLWNGTPVLTSNFGAMKEVAIQGGCLLVDSTKEQDIYNALDTLITNPTEINKLKDEIKKCTFPDWTTYSSHLLNECLSLF